MRSSPSGSFRFFRVSGIQVYVHWSWFLVAWLAISTRRHAYSSWGWNVAEYLGLFLIVLLHEFGHVLACRQTGGVAKSIMPPKNLPDAEATGARQKPRWSAQSRSSVARRVAAP
jgi:hypothetical protein